MRHAFASSATLAGPALSVGRPSLILAWIGLIGLATALGLGAVENLLLVSTGGAMGLSLLLWPALPRRVLPVACAFAALFSLYAGLTVLAPTARGLANTINIAVSAAFFLFFAGNAPRFVRFPGTALVCLGAAALIAIGGLAAGGVAKNTISGLCAYLILTAGLLWTARGHGPKRTGVLTFALVGAMGVLLGHRAMAGVGFTAALAFGAIWIVPLNVIRNLILIGLVAGIVLLIALYARLWGFDIRDLDALVREASGRTASSGRQVIWPLIIHATSDHVWFGLGSGMLFEQLYNSHWSAHSYFLQIYLQSGVAGLACLVAVLLTVWRAIGRPRRSEPVGIYLSACFMVVLIHSALEVFLMQANPTIGAGAWMTLGLGVGLLEDRRRTGPARARETRLRVRQEAPPAQAPAGARPAGRNDDMPR